jgi:hypothetical protein
MGEKMPLTTTQVIEVKLRIECTKPPLKGRNFHASRKYAKIVTVEEPLGKVTSVKYFLLKDKQWLEVGSEEFREATSKENEQKIGEELTDGLKKRVEEAYRTAKQ